MIGHMVYVQEERFMRRGRLLEIGENYIVVGEDENTAIPAHQQVYFHVTRVLHIPQDCDKHKPTPR